MTEPMTAKEALSVVEGLEEIEGSGAYSTPRGTLALKYLIPTLRAYADLIDQPADRREAARQVLVDWAELAHEPRVRTVSGPRSRPPIEDAIDRILSLTAPRAKPDEITVKKSSLLTVVRHLDCDAGTRHDFLEAFDDMRAAFTPDEIAYGQKAYQEAGE